MDVGRTSAEGAFPFRAYSLNPPPLPPKQMDSAIGDYREWANGVGDLILDWVRDGQESTATQVLQAASVSWVFSVCSCLFCAGIAAVQQYLLVYVYAVDIVRVIRTRTRSAMYW